MPPLLRSLSLNPLPSLQRKSPPRLNLWQRSPWKNPWQQNLSLSLLRLNLWKSLWQLSLRQSPQLRSLRLRRR